MKITKKKVAKRVLYIAELMPDGVWRVNHVSMSANRAHEILEYQKHSTSNSVFRTTKSEAMKDVLRVLNREAAECDGRLKKVRSMKRAQIRETARVYDKRIAELVGHRKAARAACTKFAEQHTVGRRS